MLQILPNINLLQLKVADPSMALLMKLTNEVAPNCLSSKESARKTLLQDSVDLLSTQCCATLNKKVSRLCQDDTISQMAHSSGCVGSGSNL